MNCEIMKTRTEKQLANMGCGNEAKMLIEKYWDEVSYLKAAREKALYIIANVLKAK